MILCVAYVWPEREEKVISKSNIDDINLQKCSAGYA